MPKKIRQLKSDLRQAGFVERPGKGSHVIFTHPLLPTEKFSFSGRDGDDAQDYQTKKVRDLIQRVENVQRDDSWR